MAKADYCRCAVCGEKAFYDAQLNYESSRDGSGLRNLEGKAINLKLGYCAQLVAVCEDCYGKGWRANLRKD